MERTAVQVAKRIWASFPRRQRLLLRGIWLSWAQTAWVTSLHLWYQISGTRVALLGFAIGCLASTSALFVYAQRMMRAELERIAYHDALEAFRAWLN